MWSGSCTNSNSFVDSCIYPITQHHEAFPASIKLNWNDLKLLIQPHQVVFDNEHQLHYYPDAWNGRMWSGSCTNSNSFVNSCIHPMSKHHEAFAASTKLNWNDLKPRSNHIIKLHSTMSTSCIIIQMLGMGACGVKAAPIPICLAIVASIPCQSS